MGEIGVHGAAGYVVIDGIVELVVSDMSHNPNNGEYPQPGAGSVHALKWEFTVEWIEEEMSQV